nr:MAG TPA: hypothetical protein [Caudoviricetes sp.]
MHNHNGKFILLKNNTIYCAFVIRVLGNQPKHTAKKLI